MSKLHSVFVFAIIAATTATGQQLDVTRHASAITSRLTPISHPPLPGYPSLFWLGPVDARIGAAERASSRTTTARAAAETPLTRFARGVQLFVDGDYATAFPLVSAPALASTPLADYARYYTGFTELRLERLDDAEKTLDALAARKPTGYLAEAIALRRAEEIGRAHV